MNLHTAFQGATGRRVNTLPPSMGGGQSLLLPPTVPPSLAPSGTGSSDKVMTASGQPGSTRSGTSTHYTRRLDDSTSSASSNGGGAVSRVRKSLQVSIAVFICLVLCLFRGRRDFVLQEAWPGQCRYKG